MGRVEGAAAPRPGIYAHSAFHHADGSWPLLYAYLRLELGLAPADAHERAASIGQSRRPRVRMDATDATGSRAPEGGTAWTSN
jgi:hypothetical protein